MSRDDPTRRPFEGYTGPLMTLGNMRANGVRMLDAWCLARGCNHHSVVDESPGATGQARCYSGTSGKEVQRP